MTPRNVVLEGDALVMLGRLAADSVDCVLTSPRHQSGSLAARSTAIPSASS
jgi:hypothetical protein